MKCSSMKGVQPQRRFASAPRPATQRWRLPCAARETAWVDSARKFYEECWSTGQVALLDTLMAEGHEQLDMVWQPTRSGGGLGGRGGMQRGILAYRGAYPDLQFKVLELGTLKGEGKGLKVPAAAQAAPPPTPSSTEAPGTGSTSPAGGSTGEEKQYVGSVFVHWEASGTNTGSMGGGPPTGKRVTFSGMSRLDFDEENRIARSFVYRQAPDAEVAYFMARGITPSLQGEAQKK